MSRQFEQKRTRRHQSHCRSYTGPIMDSQVFNPNPTIFATTQPTASRRAAQARLSLWLLDGGDDYSDYDSDGEPEPIDADEIFGMISPLSRLDFTAERHFR